MARTKKHINYSTPSLFGENELLGLDDAPVAARSLPGMDRHIKVALERKEREHQAATLPEPIGALRQDPKVLFMSFGSGSSGNCTYIGTRDSGLLVDAGVDDKRVEAELNRNGISIDAVRGIVLTHDHGDHIRYAYSLLRRQRHIALYCTPRVLNGILRRHNIARRIRDYHHAIYKEIPFELAGFTVTAFEVDHDGSDNAGFNFTRPDGFDFTVATDLGKIGARADYYLRRASYIMIESNYDLDMLRHGSYPEYLKARIMASNGHLDNAVTAAYIASIYRPELKHIFLCHLSRDNNTPDKALAAVNDALAALGVTAGDGSGSPASMSAPIQVMALPRFDSTGLVTLRLIHP